MRKQRRSTAPRQDIMSIPDGYHIVDIRRLQTHKYCTKHRRFWAECTIKARNENAGGSVREAAELLALSCPTIMVEKDESPGPPIEAEND